jgi:hypothetical protein
MVLLTVLLTVPTVEDASRVNQIDESQRQARPRA